MRAKLKSIEQLEDEFKVKYIDRGFDTGYEVSCCGCVLFINDDMVYMFGSGKHYEFTPVPIETDYTHEAYDENKAFHKWSFHKSWFESVEYLSEDDFKI